MGKLVLVTLLALASPLLLEEGAMPNPTITIDPNPPIAGEKATITYTGPKGTVLNLEWDPEAQPTSVTVDRFGKATIVVPANATSLVISDPTGGAQSVGYVVQP